MNELRRMVGRERFLVGVVLVCAAAFVLRLVQIQVVQHGHWVRVAKRQSVITRSQKPGRGEIHDRSGRPLATTLPLTYAVGYRPRAGRNVPALASALAPYVELSAVALTERLKANSFVLLNRGVDEQVKQELESLELPGLQFDEEPRRFYPSGSTAASVIGFTNVDGKGLEGIEAFLDDELSGKSYRSQSRVDAFREQLARITEAPAESLGATVTLTLSLELQALVEEKLRAGVANLDCERACALLVDPRNGDLLALATTPSFDPNQPADSPAEYRQCWALTDVFEPGSTLKIVPISLALETGRVERLTRINCEHGQYTIHGKTISDSKPHDRLTMDEVLAYSSNIGAAKIALRFTPSEIFDRLRALGFGNRTQIELPWEQPGVVPLPADWSGTTQVTLAYGHGMSCTALQLAYAYACIANDGILMEPRLVQSVDHPSGTHRVFPPQVVRQALPPSTAAVLREMLENVVLYGTAQNLKVNGLRFAGKTGTAKKVDVANKRYFDHRYIASFVGFFPVEDPRYVLLVVVDDPRGGEYYGATVAGPIFRSIVEEMLLAGCPGLSLSASPQLVQRKTQADSTAPLASRTRPGLRDDQWDLFTTTATAGVVRESSDTSWVMVPDVGGQPLRDALEELSRRGLTTRLSGTRIVMAQLPAAGTLVPVGSTCQLRGASF